MKKPHALREYLLNAIPDLPQDPDRLLIFANDGKLTSTAANGYSFEMAYTLDMIITDYAGDVDVFGIVLFTWIQDNQSELMANLTKAKEAITFEAELIDNSKYDLHFKIPLTERVIVKKNDEGKFEISYPTEPQYTEFGPPTDFELIDKDGSTLATWRTADMQGRSLDMPFPGKSP
ncbi:phage tail protein [Acinetobacter calcoaceticus]|uniref:phage tail protein n=1 Tax=Acinetobacter calcoaceticus TaxID=471 RepID=UPI0002CFC3DC|nr:phage tail protein [Acinetobacter calcoaceticus]ENU11090.1 hypothetical protein F997_00095 [Acinetobacter calcoaceticus NIPH 13]